MRAPAIYVVVKTSGDGYGHNSYEYISWHFDESEAREYAETQPRAEHGGTWYDVEKVPAATPMPDKERW